MAHRSMGGGAVRMAGVLALAGVAWLSSAGTAGAATPDPLGGPLTPVTGPVATTVTQLLGGNGTPAPPAVPSPPVAPAVPSVPALPALPGSAPSNQGSQGSGASAQAQAPAGDDRAAVDAAVAQFLGVCARVPQEVVPVRATVVVLDRDIIAELVDAGVPLRPLVVPCPGPARGTDAPAASAVPGSVVPAASGPGGADASGSALPAGLAFTGTELTPMLLSAAGLIALGVAFLRKAYALAPARTGELSAAEAHG